MLKKSYKLIRFMNRERHPVVRYMLGGLAATGTLVATGSRSLTRQSWLDFKHGDVKAGFRRCGWYASKSWLGLKPLDDQFFIFPEGLSNDSLKPLESFLERRKAKISESEFLSDLLLVRGQCLHNMIEAGEPNSAIDRVVFDFYTTANKLLKLVPSLDWLEASVPMIASSNERKGDFSRDDAASALRDFADILPLDDWPWFVESGTFLGLHREGDFLRHDYDIDLGIDYDVSRVDQIIRLFTDSSRFVVKKIDDHVRISKQDHSFSIHHLPSLIKLVHVSGINVDIFLHHNEGEYSYHGSSIHWWKNRCFDLERRILAGVEVNAPSQADRYLSENYGDWRTPVTDFDCTSGTPNLTIARNFLSVALFLKRLLVFSIESPKDAIKVRNALLASGVIVERNGALEIKEYI